MANRSGMQPGRGSRPPAISIQYWIGQSKGRSVSLATADIMVAPMNTLKIGLVGCGYWGVNLCRVLAQHPQVDLRWICDSSPKALERARRLAPQAALSTKLEESLADGEVDGVVVAVPVENHYQVAMAALQVGAHVLVEKPLCRTVGDATSLCEEAARRQRVLMVGHTFLYSAPVRRIKAMIDDGELGEIRYMFMRRLNLGIVRHDVDALWNLAPHDLSILNYWIDRPVVQLSAVGHCYLQPGIADVVFAHMTYEGNIAAHIQVSWLDPSKVRQATVVGSRRMLLYDDVSNDARITVYDKGIDANDLTANLGGFDTYAQHQFTVRAGDAWLPRIDFNEPLIEEISDFVGSIIERRQPLASGVSGLTVVQQLDRLSAAMTEAARPHD
jgi:predicted dehydrogenase